MLKKMMISSALVAAIFVGTSAYSATQQQWIKNNKCTPCPANATCDGTKFTCKAGYVKSGNACVAKPSNNIANSVGNSGVLQAVSEKDSVEVIAAVSEKDSVEVVESVVEVDSKKKATCTQGSHIGFDWIKKHYSGCTKCRTENIAAGKCSKNKKAHKHYYCECNC